ncbi:uncharacterized protein LOC132704544 isoform X2 [Cylas formicarius]|nr:uncharacterized protein LOC132704544 isoform X2 [Cylas formicarius]XP_060530577.1 uncharacterized protein LOC132704544 isoform X2 [Cylas formicarius]
MRAPEMNNCCGFSLKHGTIIIGVVQSIFAFMCLILSSAYAHNSHELIELSDPSIIPRMEVLRVFLIIVGVASALQCVFSIFLIFGAETNRPVLLLPWLGLNPATLAVYIVATLIAIVHHTADDNTPFVVGHVLISTVVTLVVIYNILTVYSFYKHLRKLNF